VANFLLSSECSAGSAVAKAGEFAAFAQLRYINAELRKQIDDCNSCGPREVE
jgi:hypothetical protein